MNKAVKQYMKKIGSKGGRTRMKRLTAEQRTAIVRKAAKARWTKPATS